MSEVGVAAEPSETSEHDPSTWYLDHVLPPFGIALSSPALVLLPLKLDLIGLSVGVLRDGSSRFQKLQAIWAEAVRQGLPALVAADLGLAAEEWQPRQGAHETVLDHDRLLTLLQPRRPVQAQLQLQPRRGMVSAKVLRWQALSQGGSRGQWLPVVGTGAVRTVAKAARVAAGWSGVKGRIAHGVQYDLEWRLRGIMSVTFGFEVSENERASVIYYCGFLVSGAKASQCLAVFYRWRLEYPCSGSTGP
jgi:hypothetical protein